MENHIPRNGTVGTIYLEDSDQYKPVPIPDQSPFGIDRFIVAICGAMIVILLILLNWHEKAYPRVDSVDHQHTEVLVTGLQDLPPEISKLK